MTSVIANTSQHTTFLTYKRSLIDNRSRFFAYGLLQVMESGQDCYQTCHFKWFFLWKLFWHAAIPFWKIFKQFAVSLSRGWWQSTWRGKDWRFPEAIQYCWWLFNILSRCLYNKQWNPQSSSSSLSVWQLYILVWFLQNV